ncbi:MAG: S49 family peptidase [Pseudomonadota bacterium]
MPHEIDRILRSAAAMPWAIDPAKAEEILGVLAFRVQNGVVDQPKPQAAAGQGSFSTGDEIAVLSLTGTVFPRANMLGVLSGGQSLEMFQSRFQEAARDPKVRAIVLDIDSPGGAVGLVPETAAMIREARDPDRPITAVANTLAASAAYWIASAADEIVVTPSGHVGSIGVYSVHDDISRALEQRGIRRSIISAGPRKVEGHSAAPLDDTARASVKREIDALYEEFVGFVATTRNADPTVVAADPEDADQHFGGGRTVRAAEAVRLGMADRVGTLSETINRLSDPDRGRRRTSLARARMHMI